MNTFQHFRTRRAPRAFTLVEVMIAMTILVVAIAGVMSAFLGTLKSTHAIADAIDVNARSRFVQERLLFDLRAITEVSAMDSLMQASDVANIFADYTGGEVSNCFRSFTAKINEYGGADSVVVTYRIEADGKTPEGKQLYSLKRTADGKSVKVLTNLEEGCFTFYTRKKDTGTLESLAASASAGVNAIRFAFLPKGRARLLPGENDPSCSAVVQLRYPSYK